MSETSFDVTMDDDVAEWPRLTGPRDERVRPLAGIATGAVLGIPCWAMLGWVVYAVCM